MKRLIPLLVAVVALTSLAGCGKRDTKIEEVRRFVENTKRDISGFTYSSAQPADLITGVKAQNVDVRGLRQDDFRFKARVDINDAPAFEEVVADDALAVRFLDPRFVGQFVNKDAALTADLTTNVAGLSVLAALGSRRWVVDNAGAPPVVRGAFDSDNVGNDPVFDAMTVLDYVDAAVKESAGIETWSPDDINPTYLPEEDVFPKPEDGSGVDRFDLIRPALPPAANTTGQSDVSLPSTRHFRRMAIYVKDDKIIRVIEVVDLKGKRLREFPRYFKALLRESSAPPEAIAAIDEALKEVPEAQQNTFILQMLNQGLVQFGQDPIFVRTMTVDFGVSPSGEGIVALPTEDAVAGALGALTLSASGQAKKSDDGSASGAGAGDGSGGASTEPATEPAGGAGQSEGDVPNADPTATVPGAPSG